MTFPKRTDEKLKGEIGINIVSKVIVNDLNHIFRPVAQEHDYGLDGYIDYVTQEGNVTGGTVGVQVKYGESYFNDETIDGYWYSGIEKHLNFLANQITPTFIFLVKPEDEKIYWVHFELNKLHKSGDNWKILVPKINEVSDSLNLYLEDLLDIKNFSSEVKEYLETKRMIKEVIPSSKLTLLAIGRESIEACNTLGAVSFFESFKVNKSEIKKYQDKISFFVYGYDDDPRELYEIPEVVTYFKKLEPEVKYWFYYLNKDKDKAMGLKVLLALLSDAKRVKDGIIEMDPAKRKDFFERNFSYLNEITEFLGLSMSENKKISENITNYFDWIKME